MKPKSVLAAAGFAVLVAGVLPASAGATPAEGDVVRTDLAKGTTNRPIWIVTDGRPTTFSVQSLVLKPGASSGWHAHPGPEQSVITKGAVVLRSAPDCAPVTFAAGQSVFIPAGVAHEVVNQGTEDADIVVTYTLPADIPARDDVGKMCP
jgi:quercetin dioxygenase-like cupin family protein